MVKQNKGVTQITTLSNRKEFTMNDLQIFSNENFSELRKIEKENTGDYTGFFYILEYGDLVKIGYTKNPYQRVMALKRNAENYGDLKLGKIALSIPHTNFSENEKKLHKKFSAYRKSGSELFDLDFQEIISKVSDIVEYKDETIQIEKRTDSFFNGMKNFILGK